MKSMNQIARSPKQIGAAIRRRRKFLNLTQGDLGKKSGIRQATISLLESGESDARLATFMDLLAALDLEMLIQPRSKGDVSDIADNF
jgi:HTH-type transcriptional regulator / antitoxin HipB